MPLRPAYLLGPKAHVPNLFRALAAPPTPAPIRAPCVPRPTSSFFEQRVHLLHQAHGLLGLSVEGPQQLRLKVLDLALLLLDLVQALSYGLGQGPQLLRCGL